MLNHNEIARRAYELYEARGREDGHDQEDWLQAERDLIEIEASTERPPAAVTPHRRKKDEAELSPVV
jgi:Protein of unknown function (DUF2934)